MKTLIKNTYIVPCDEQDKWVKGDVVFIDDKITYVTGAPGCDKDAEIEKEAYDEIIDGSSYITMPGLINAHTHSAMNLFRGAGDDMALDPWLKDCIWPMEDKMTSEDIYAGSRAAILEMIKSGTTCCMDMYQNAWEFCDVVEETGFRANVSRCVLDFDGNGDRRFKEAEELFKRDNTADGRLKIWIGIHATDTCSNRCFMIGHDMAKEHNCGVHIHLAETSKQFKDQVKATNETPVERLNKIGFFDEVPVSCAHVVWLGEDDRLIIKNKGVNVIHCPSSNLKLASGISPIPAMVTFDVNCGLGTDSVASNNNLDMFEEMKLASLIHKANLHSPTVMPAGVTLCMATRMGAKATGFTDIGVLAPGMKADIIMLNLDNANMRPLHNPVSQIVYAAKGENVDYSFINGKMVMRKREMLTLDEEKILYAVQKAADRLAGR